eukprot:COSAG01_NODE_130_length_24912_cov_83.574175_7_plen_56_part_00
MRYDAVAASCEGHLQACSSSSSKGFSLWVAYSAGQLTNDCPLLRTVVQEESSTAL